eukprot:12925305-Heterocapsa_arctica.AAC.1
MKVRMLMTAGRILDFINPSLLDPGQAWMANQLEHPFIRAVDAYAAHIKSNGLEDLKYDSRSGEGTTEASTLFLPVVNAVDGDAVAATAVLRALNILGSPAAMETDEKRLMRNVPVREFPPLMTPEGWQDGYPQIAETFVERHGNWDYTMIVQAKAGIVTKILTKDAGVLGRWRRALRQ